MEQKNEDILVSIITLAYNHESYIRECLDGILMQKTSFKFELLIHDDASTDNTANIIREYEIKHPNIIKPIYQIENQYSKGVPIGGTYLYPRAKGKYIALCEGDDYWTDPLKLQKQVDVLEKHEEYGCVYTAYKTVDKQGTPLDYPPSVMHMQRSFTGDVFHELLIANFPQTLTVLYRKDLLAYKFIPPYVVDYSLFLSLAIQKKFYYLPESTGAYRINPIGLVQSGELGREFDFMVIKLYFFIEYLRCKSFKRNKKDHKLIKELLLLECCNIPTIKNNYKLFFRLIYYRPLYIIKIPLYLLKRLIKKLRTLFIR